jgi:hypothetical protein
MHKYSGKYVYIYFDKFLLWSHKACILVNSCLANEYFFFKSGGIIQRLPRGSVISLKYYNFLKIFFHFFFICFQQNLEKNGNLISPFNEIVTIFFYILYLIL